jgi:hypothetical protein
VTSDRLTTADTAALKRIAGIASSRKFATRSTWRAQTVVEATDMRTQLRWLLTQTAETPETKALTDAIHLELEIAENIALTRRSLKQILTGANVLAAKQCLDAAIINLLRLAPLEQVQSMLPNLYAEAAASLPSSDVRLSVLAKFSAPPEKVEVPFTESERFAIISAFRASQQQAHREMMRIRNFRDVIVGVSLAITVLGMVAAIASLFNPGILSLCFTSQSGIVCPTGEFPLSKGGAAPQPLDTTVVEFVGLLAAGIAGATALRNIRSTSDPYSLAIALAFLKLPTGGMTAFLGLLLLRANLVPTVTTSVAGPAQVIALALVLGYAQQLLTGLVDRQAQTILAETRQPSNQ